MEPYRILERDAERIRSWIETRGGAHVWDSCNLSDPGARWVVPVRHPDGTVNEQKPHWGAGRVIRTLTRLDEVEVVTGQLVRKFHVGVRMGSQGMMLKVTEGGSRRIRAAVEKAGDGAWYEFDYSTQDACIYAPGPPQNLAVWQPS